MFTSPIKREIRTFHVVVVRRRKRNVLKTCAARAKLFFFCRSRCRCRRPCLSSLIPNCKLIEAFLGPVYMEQSCNLVCPSYPPHLPSTHPWTSQLFFISFQNLAKRLHEEHKVCWAKRVGHPFFNVRVTLLARPTFLHIDTLACPVNNITTNNTNNDNTNNNNDNNNSVIYSRQYL